MNQYITNILTFNSLKYSTTHYVMSKLFLKLFSLSKSEKIEFFVISRDVLLDKLQQMIDTQS